MTKDGAGLVRVFDYENEMEISDLYVDERERQKGIGTSLMVAAINHCMSLHEHGKMIVETNHNSSAWVDEWYKRLGFKFERMQAPMAAILGDDVWSNVYSKEF